MSRQFGFSKTQKESQKIIKTTAHAMGNRFGADMGTLAKVENLACKLCQAQSPRKNAAGDQYYIGAPIVYLENGNLRFHLNDIFGAVDLGDCIVGGWNSYKAGKDMALSSILKHVDVAGRMDDIPDFAYEIGLGKKALSLPIPLWWVN
jgi:hypothetical protein